MAGYSGTPLPQKLGLKPEARLGIWAAPPDFSRTLGALPARVKVGDAARGSSAFDVIVCFVESCAELDRRLSRLSKRLDPAGGLWLCWPKKASSVATDLTEAEVRARGLAAGLVDNKVCAIDAVWSGLRFVVRVQDRPKAPRRAEPAASKKAPKRAKPAPREAALTRR